MTEDFLTMGLREDRYLKAIELLEQFDNEIEVTLRDVGNRMVERRPELFVADVEGAENIGRSKSSSKNWARVDFEMDSDLTPDGQRQRLNVHLYWASPTEYGRNDVDGALRAFGYKIKGGSTDADAEVVREMGDDYGLDTGPGLFGSNTIFYRHVSSTEEIEETAQAMIEHFETFADHYVVE